MRNSTANVASLTNRAKDKFSIQVEALECRTLLSTTVMPSWSELLASQPNPSIANNLGSVSAVEPVNGDLILAGEGYSPVSDTSVIAVAAFENDGAGGLTLDTSFGDYSNDTGVPAAPGYSFVNLSALMPGNPSVSTTV